MPESLDPTGAAEQYCYRYVCRSAVGASQSLTHAAAGPTKGGDKLDFVCPGKADFGYTRHMCGSVSEPLVVLNTKQLVAGCADLGATRTVSSCLHVVWSMLRYGGFYFAGVGFVQFLL